MGSRTLGDINLSDEYLSIGLEDSLTEAIHRFLSFESGVLIVLNDNNKARCDYPNNDSKSNTRQKRLTEDKLQKNNGK